MRNCYYHGSIVTIPYIASKLHQTFLFLKGFLLPSSFRSSHHLDYLGFLLHIPLTPLC